MKAKRSNLELMVLTDVLLIAQAFGYKVEQFDRAIDKTDEGKGGDAVIIFVCGEKPTDLPVRVVRSSLVPNDDSGDSEKPDNVDLKSLDLLTA